MNAGKSTLLNSLTQQATAIVDRTPGTTADVKAALLELHGLGPVKVWRSWNWVRGWLAVNRTQDLPDHTNTSTSKQLLDTAGVDDSGELGEKKKAKSLQALKEVDLALLVIDPFTKVGADGGGGRADPARLALLGSLLAEVTRRGRQVRELIESPFTPSFNARSSDMYMYA